MKARSLVASLLEMTFFIILTISAPSFGEEPKRQPPPQGKPLTLSDCYALALKTSETIAIHQELIAQAEARFTQSLSGVLPRVSFSSSDKRQDGSGSSAFTLKTVPERKFVMSQPLFSGFKEFAAMAGTKAEKRQRVQERIRAEQLLLLDVADAFTLLLEQSEDLRTLETTREVLLDRINELRQREDLGRSRPSERLSAQTQVYRVEAEMELVRSRETAAAQLLEFLSGREPIGEILDTEPSTPAVGDRESYLAKAGSRPDVRAAEEAMEVAKQQVRVEQGKYWPTVGLEGNYYVERVGNAKDVTWDAALKVDVPLFEGGQTRGAVRQAASQAAQAKLQFSQERRTALHEIRDAYAQVEAALIRNAALGRALEASEESYRFQVEEYRPNLVNNLEVLQAIREFQDAHRDMIHAKFESRRLVWRLRVAAGEVP
ncbi:MAG: TolC family protein [Candidatus Omnitrophica bacterium]|nr:TolC family protein [Candidatus Omnitrophota bacterium]